MPLGVGLRASRKLRHVPKRIAGEEGVLAWVGWSVVGSPHRGYSGTLPQSHVSDSEGVIMETAKSTLLPVNRFPLLALLVSVCIAGQLHAGSFSYSDFSSTAGLTLNGNAAQSGSVLRLVPNVDSQSGTAFRTSAISLDGTTAFSTAFEFNVSTDPGDPLMAFHSCCRTMPPEPMPWVRAGRD